VVVLPEGFALHAFEAIDGRLMYAILALRQRVFVVEQRCVFQDADGRDADALHLVHVPAGSTTPDAYLRMFLRPAPGQVVIGRVVTAPEARGTGLGHRLFAASLEACEILAPGRDVHIAAQAHLEAWYSKHRFETISAPYLDDDIPHVDMVLRRPQRPHR